MKTIPKITSLLGSALPLVHVWLHGWVWPSDMLLVSHSSSLVTEPSDQTQKGFFSFISNASGFFKFFSEKLTLFFII